MITVSDELERKWTEAILSLIRGIFAEFFGGVEDNQE
jgi:hypothetical protein